MERVLREQFHRLQVDGLRRGGGLDVAGLEEDGWVVAKRVDGELERGVLKLRLVAREADEPGDAGSEVVIEQVVIGGEACDISEVLDAEKALFVWSGYDFGDGKRPDSGLGPVGIGGGTGDDTRAG